MLYLLNGVNARFLQRLTKRGAFVALLLQWGDVHIAGSIGGGAQIIGLRVGDIFHAGTTAAIYYTRRQKVFELLRFSYGIECAEEFPDGGGFQC